MDKTLSNTPYFAGLSVTAFSFTFNEVVAVAGLLVALATFAVNLTYKHLHYRLAKKRLEKGGSHAA